MTRIAGLICNAVLFIALAGIGCMPSSKGADNVAGAGESKIPTGRNTAVVFLTGNVLGTLQPCGCSVDQLGGFDRRQAVIDTIPKNRRVAVDTGNMLAGKTEQDIIKFGIIMQALFMLEYDLVHLNDNEFKLADELGLTQGMPFEIIDDSADTSVKAHWSRILRIADRKLILNIASIKADSGNVDSLKEFFTTDLSVNILIADACSDSFVDQVAALNIVDVIICPSNADEPRIIDKDRKKPLVISVGRLGKYFGKLTVELTKDDELKLHYTKVGVDNKLKQNDDLVELYKYYQMIIKEEGLLEKHPKTPLPDGLKYLGSENCHSCHDEFDKWAKNRHAHAYESLVKVGSQYDPECIGCHVVGFGYESGFVSEKSKKDLRNVGCEVCHGPGSDHMNAVTTGRTDSGLSDVITKCAECHTPERSPGYPGHEKEYLQKIIHWREPKAKNTVKN